MGRKNTGGTVQVARELMLGFENLPILERLEFAKNLLLSRGGDPDSVPVDPLLVAVSDVVIGVIEVLRAHPDAGRLRIPEP
jgi:hypothetical protein